MRKKSVEILPNDGVHRMHEGIVLKENVRSPPELSVLYIHMNMIMNLITA